MPVSTSESLRRVVPVRVTPRLREFDEIDHDEDEDADYGHDDLDETDLEDDEDHREDHED